MSEKPEKTYNTVEAAKKANIGRATLNRWLEKGVIDVDPTRKFPTANGFMRRWSDADIKRLIQYRNEHHWEMPGSKRSEK